MDRPGFHPKDGALCYVRVLLIPTPRWSTYDAVRAGLPLLEGVPATVHERAWTKFRLEPEVLFRQVYPNPDRRRGMAAIGLLMLGWNLRGAA